MNWALDLNFLASQNLQWNSASCLSLMVTPPPPPGPGPSPDTFLMLPAPPCHETWSHWTLGTVYCKGVGSDQVVTVLLVSRLRVTVTPAAAQCTLYKPHISDTGGMYTLHRHFRRPGQDPGSAVHCCHTVHSSQNMLEGGGALHHLSHGTYLLIQLVSTVYACI